MVEEKSLERKSRSVRVWVEVNLNADILQKKCSIV